MIAARAFDSGVLPPGRVSQSTLEAAEEAAAQTLDGVASVESVNPASIALWNLTDGETHPNFPKSADPELGPSA